MRAVGILNLIGFLAIVNLLFSQSNNVTIVGWVLDSETSQPIAGTRIQVDNTNRGTFSSSRGFFRLVDIPQNATLTISSLAYETKKVTRLKDVDTLIIKLRPKPLKYQTVEKIGEITPEELIRRVIRKKKENIGLLKIIQGKVYSKMSLELGGSTFKSLQEITVFGTDYKKEERDTTFEIIKNFILETFYDLYIDFEKKVKFTNITNRRQTANFPSQFNLLTLTEFYNLFEDNIKIGEALFVSPLSEKALDYYNFQIVGRGDYQDDYVFDVVVEPKTSSYPLFKGKIKIVERNYNVIELDLEVNPKNAIPYFEEYKLVQKFVLFEGKYLYPTYLQIFGDLKFDIVKGPMDITTKFNVVSIFENILINQPLPDSIYSKAKVENIAVSPAADTTRTEFWENFALFETSESEKQIYKRIDSLMKAKNLNIDSLFNEVIAQVSKEPGFFELNDFISSSFNRVAGYILELRPNFNFLNFKFDILPQYSFNRKEFFGKVSLNYNKTFAEKFLIKSRNTVGISVFKEIKTIGLDTSFSMSLNSISSAIFGFDYYDYFIRKGFSVVYRTWNLENANFGICYYDVEHSPIETIQIRDWFGRTLKRANPRVDPKKLRYFQFDLKFGDKIWLNPLTTRDAEKFSYQFAFYSVFGENATNGLKFAVFEPSLTLVLPTFFTGYKPVQLIGNFAYGWATTTAPMEMTFRINGGFDLTSIYSSRGIFAGGEEYIRGLVIFDIKDIWWRLLGLPTFRGRGVELYFASAFAKVFGASFYSNFDNTMFTEAGVGFWKIPTFISDLLNFGFEVRYGLSAPIKRRVGWNVFLKLGL